MSSDWSSVTRLTAALGKCLQKVTSVSSPGCDTVAANERERELWVQFQTGNENVAPLGPSCVSNNISWSLWISISRKNTGFQMPGVMNKWFTHFNANRRGPPEKRRLIDSGVEGSARRLPESGLVWMSEKLDTLSAPLFRCGRAAAYLNHSVCTFHSAGTVWFICDVLLLWNNTEVGHV